MWLIAEANGIPSENKTLLHNYSCNVEESEKPNDSDNCRPAKAAPFSPWMVQESHQTSMQLMNSTFLYFRPK